MREKLTGQRVGREVQRKRALGGAVVAVARLRVASRAAEDEVGVVVEEVAEAVVVAVHYDAVVARDHLDERGKVGLVVARRDVGVVQLQELPGRVGGGEGRGQEVGLDFCVGVAGGGVGVAVDGGIRLVAVEEAVGVDHDEGRSPVGADQVVGVVG